MTARHEYHRTSLPAGPLLVVLVAAATLLVALGYWLEQLGDLVLLVIIGTASLIALMSLRERADGSS